MNVSTLLQFTYKKRYPFIYTQTDHQPHISVTYFFILFFLHQLSHNSGRIKMLHKKKESIR